MNWADIKDGKRVTREMRKGDGIKKVGNIILSMKDQHHVID